MYGCFVRILKSFLYTSLAKCHGCGISERSGIYCSYCLEERFSK